MIALDDVDDKCFYGKRSYKSDKMLDNHAPKEIKVLVVDDKRMATLEQAVKGEVV